MISRTDALNVLLAAVGQRPVTSQNNLHPGALSAQITLDSINKSFQSEGWPFNTSTITLSAQVGSGEVKLPLNFLQVDPTDVHSTLVVRSGKLFDPATNSHNLGIDVEIVLTILLDIGDLPHSAAHFMTSMAALKHYSDKDGDARGMANLQTEVVRSEASFYKAFFRKRDLSALHSPMAQRLLSGLRPRGVSRNPNVIGG